MNIYNTKCYILVFLIPQLTVIRSFDIPVEKEMKELLNILHRNF